MSPPDLWPSGPEIECFQTQQMDLGPMAVWTHQMSFVGMGDWARIGHCHIRHCLLQHIRLKLSALKVDLTKH